MNKNLNHHLSIRKDSRCFVFQIIAKKNIKLSQKRCIYFRYFFRIPDILIKKVHLIASKTQIRLETIGKNDHPTEQHPLVAMVDTLRGPMWSRPSADVWLLFSARSWDDVHMYIYIYALYIHIYYIQKKYIYIYVVKPASWRTFFRKANGRNSYPQNWDFSEAQKRWRLWPFLEDYPI